MKLILTLSLVLALYSATAAALVAHVLGESDAALRSTIVATTTR